MTSAGNPAAARRARPARRDAMCLAGTRLAGMEIVGKTNLHEFGMGVTGVNPWFGTPQNPRYPERVPGGSSSGSAVAVASREVHIAFGTDTGGSVRIPAACCAVYGLQTTRQSLVGGCVASKPKPRHRWGVGHESRVSYSRYGVARPRTFR